MAQREPNPGTSGGEAQDEDDVAMEVELPTNIYILNDDQEFSITPRALREFLNNFSDHYKGKNMTFTPQMILWHNEMKRQKDLQAEKAKRKVRQKAKKKEAKKTVKATELCLSLYGFIAKKEELIGTGQRCVRKPGDAFHYTGPGSAARSLYDENGLACILGLPGEGKSTTANFITKPTDKENTRRRLANEPPIWKDRPRSPAPHYYKLVYARRPDTFNLRLQAHGYQVFVMEDPFGIHSLNLTRLEAWLDTLGDVMTQVKASNNHTRLIITCGTHVYEEMKNYLRGRHMFPPSQTVDMGNPPVGFPPKERITLFQNQVPGYTLSQATERVLPSQRFESYPLACRIFLTFKGRRETPDFFSDPFANFENEVESILTLDKIVYAVLVWVAVRDKPLYLNEKELSSIPTEELEVFKTILEALEVNLKENKYFTELGEADMIALRGAAEILNGTFLQPIEEDIYKMVHHRHREYVLRHFARNHLPTLVKLVSSDTFLEMFTTANIPLSPHHRLVVVPPSQFNIPIERLIQQIMSGDICLAARHRMLSDPDFAERFVSSLQEQKKVMEIFSKLDEGGRGLLFWAVWYSHDSLVCSVINREDVQSSISKDLMGRLYVLACYRGCYLTVKVLLERGYKATQLPDIPPEGLEKVLGFEAHHDLTSSSTPVHLACLSNNAQMLELLLSEGGSPTVANMYGDTPLHLAAGRGNDQMVDLLLSKEASVAAAMPSGKVPLQDAVVSGSLQTVSLLIAKGANPKEKRDDGLSHINAAIVHADLDMVKLLVDKTDGTVQPYQRLWYPMSQALYFGDVRVADFLVEKKRADYFRGYFGSNPLIWALEGQDGEMADFLLEQYMFVDTSDKSGNRPIHIAARRHLVKQVKHLLRLGANVLITNNKDETPAQAAFHACLGESADHKCIRDLLNKETEKQKKAKEERENSRKVVTPMDFAMNTRMGPFMMKSKFNMY